MQHTAAVDNEKHADTYVNKMEKGMQTNPLPLTHTKKDDDIALNRQRQ